MTVIGQFALSSKLGYGKIVGCEKSDVLVEFFISPWKRTTQSFRLNVKAIQRLPRQTRVFIEQNGQWRMGRIEMEYARDQGGYDYQVRFPNRVTEELPGESLFVRCLAPFDDPTAMLANIAMETQFWHDRRENFIGQLMIQRKASRGLYTLFSSSIEFVPHQIEVVRRVLEDPLQRYVLADEVGMGKTIEAGLILRQFLLTNDSGIVWVVVPIALVAQWQRELEHKFFIKDFGDRVRVYSFDEISDVKGDTPQFIVVDEAHHLVSSTIPEWLGKFGRQAERLLLLTATPSLANSKVLLRLLQLIDPIAYADVADTDFETRVAQREQLGIFLRGFRANTTTVLLRQRLRQLAERFPNDADAQRLGEEIARALEAGEREVLQSQISSLRSHIADVYRIHQRLVRSRRRDAADWVFRPRGSSVDALGQGDLSHVLQTWAEEARVSEFAEILEQWRIEFATRYPRGTSKRFEVQRVFVSLFEGLASSARAFAKKWKQLPEDLSGSALNASFDAVMAESPELGATDRSRSIARAIADSVRQFRTTHRRAIHAVVFGSDAEDLSRCADAVASELGNRSVLMADALAENEGDIAALFESDPNAEVLFCGRKQEEGLNLHFSHLLVHLDLPLSPERIEQRIGRLDRFGRKDDVVKQRIVLPGGLEEATSLWDAWLEVLADGFHVFNTTLTDVQFQLAELTGVLADAMLEDGAAGLRAAVVQVRERLLRERERLDDQYALDRVLQDEEGAASFCQHLEDAEADEAVLSDQARKWFVDCIRFRFNHSGSDTFTIDWDANDTLLPTQPWAHTFRGSLTGPKTFGRRVANQSKKPVQLLRVGSPLYVAAERHLQWEDRGTAFATWRCEPSIGDTTWFAFKLCYQIEGVLPSGIRPDEQFALRARVDGYLPPWIETLYIGSDLVPISDPAMLEILCRPYIAGTIAGGDLNIGSRPELLQQVIDPELFNRLCRAVRKESENWLLNRSDFRATISDAVTRGKLDLARRLRRLQLRLAAFSLEHAEESGLVREIELVQLLVGGLGTPKVRLDAIGVIVVGGRPLNANALQ